MEIESLNISNTQQIFCNVCEQETRHHCEGEYYDEPNPNEFYRYRLYRCSQCEDGTLERFYSCEVMYAHHEEWEEVVIGFLRRERYLEEDEEIWGEYDYSSRSRQFDLKPKEFDRIPQKLKTIYEETINALNRKSKILCGIGVRALLEGICVEQGVPITGKKGGPTPFKAKLEALQATLGDETVKSLEKIAWLGNDAAHQLIEPSKKEVILALDICETMLTLFYNPPKVQLAQKAKAFDRIHMQKKNRPQSSRWDDWSDESDW